MAKTGNTRVTLWRACSRVHPFHSKTSIVSIRRVADQAPSPQERVQRSWRVVEKAPSRTAGERVASSDERRLVTGCKLLLKIVGQHGPTVAHNDVYAWFHTQYEIRLFLDQVAGSKAGEVVRLGSKVCTNS